MIPSGEALSDSDFARLAELHVASIDDSLPGLLGPAFAARFYRFMAGSEHEALFFERAEESGAIEGACLVSFEPESVYGRILRSTLPALALASLRALARADFRAFLRSYLRDRIAGTSHAQPPPEITYIFTDAESRSRGVGRRLLERIEEWLGERGVPALYVKTIDSPENRALDFYARNGFSRVGTRLEGGRTFTAFRKSLEGP